MKLPRWWICLRLAVAGVWLYQGLWLKIIAVEPRHLEIVSSVPSGISPRIALGLIGMMETIFAPAVIFKWSPRIFAFAQIGVLIAMNTCGILFAGDRIPDIPGMITMNCVFALAIWGLAHHENQGR